MHAFVLEIIYSNYLRNVCPSIHISIFFALRFQLFKIYIFDLNCKLTFQSLLLLLFKVSNQEPERTPSDEKRLGQSFGSDWPQFAKILLFHWSAKFIQSKNRFQTFWPHSLSERTLWGGLLTDFCQCESFIPWKQWKTVDWQDVQVLLAFTSCAMKMNQLVWQC